MNSYFVRILINVSGYEKYVGKVIVANNEDQAQAMALYSECHNTHALDWQDVDHVFDSHEFSYQVDWVQRLKERQAAILSKYLSAMAYDPEELADSGFFKQTGINEL